MASQIRGSDNFDTATVGITSGTSVATTSGTSIDFTGIPAGTKRITVMFNNVSLSGASHLLVQMGNTTPETSGYTSNTTYNTNAGQALLASVAGIPIQGGAAAYAIYGSLVLTNISVMIARKRVYYAWWDRTNSTYFDNRDYSSPKPIQ